ncbi:MAG: hypothetical protein AB9869_13345 [Verrucomicrobiia bacterium]
MLMFKLTFLSILGLCASVLGADDASLAGTYRDDRITVVLEEPQRSGADLVYRGLIRLGEQIFPFKGTFQSGQLAGTFESHGDAFDFTAVPSGRTLEFSTGGTTYRLIKPSVNPLAKPNPLAGQEPPRASMPQPRPPIPEPRPAAATPSAQGLVHLKWVSVLDDPGMIGGEAFTLLAPADWLVQGTVVWRMHPGAPAYPVVTLANSSFTEAIEALPSIPFIWMEGGIPLFPPGSHYLGNEVGEPLGDPIAYIKQIIVPRFRRGLNAAEIVSTEELPGVAETAADVSKEPGVEKKFRAARMRLEYAQNGTMIHEDIYCVLGSVTVPSARTTFWGPERNYSFKAERGKLDERTALFHEMVTSFRPNLRWFNRYLQLTRMLGQTKLDASRPPNDLRPYIARTSTEIGDDVHRVYQQQQAARERIGASFKPYLAGVARFRDPLGGKTLELPAVYSQVWVNADGERLLSRSGDISPGPDWKRAERQP